MRFGAVWAVPLGIILLAGAALLLARAPRADFSPLASSPLTAPQSVVTAEGDTIPSGLVAAMLSPAIRYSPGWRVDARGADPPEPGDAWQEPAGSFEFNFHGQTLALALAKGDYWGYVYVTVDGEPANRLAYIPGNRDSQDRHAGYTTLYAPEQDSPSHNLPESQWLLIHATPQAASRTVRLEIWRAWGQIPVRGIAVDALPAPRTQLPATLAALLGLLLLGIGWYSRPPFVLNRWGAPWLATRAARVASRLHRAGLLTYRLSPAATALAVAGVALIVVAVWLNLWWLTWGGVMLLALATLWHPVYWLAALAAALPFYYSVTLPMLPQRDLGLLDVGLFLGLFLLGTYRLFAAPSFNTGRANLRPPRSTVTALLLWLLIAWALLSTLTAIHRAQALYEWRTVFLAAGFWWLLLRWGLTVAQPEPTRRKARQLLAGGWLVGATFMALIAVGQYLGDAMLITAEGVARVRGLYGSPNNLALYLERTLLVSIGLALYLPPSTERRLRAGLWTVALIQLTALLLTFSKGALLAGIPVGFAVLWLSGLVLLPRQGRGRRPLWALLTLAVAGGLALTPFLGTERFRNLLDLESGTGFLRIQLWRSTLAMALDHPWWGVGPDNFLYAFRSHYLLPAAWQEPNLNHPHNLLLDGWTRLGVPGLLLILGFLATGAWGLYRQMHMTTGRPFASAWGAGALAATGAALAHGLIDVAYALPDLMLVWGLLFWLGDGSAARSPEKQDRRP